MLKFLVDAIWGLFPTVWKTKNIHEVILFVVTAFNLHLEMSETDISDFF